MRKLLSHFSVSYDRFSRNAQRDFKLAISVLLVLLSYRIFVMLFYGGAFQDQTGIIQYLTALLNGIRYDSVVAAYITVLPFLGSLVSLFLPLDPWNRRLRTFFMFFFMLTAVPLLFSHFLYYMEYQENFSHLALTILYDDAGAVVKTAWREYPFGKAIIVAIVCGALYLFGTRRFLEQPFTAANPRPTGKRRISIIKGVLYVVLFMLMMRGSLGPRPVEPKDAAVTFDQQLNNHVVNPYMAMLYAVEGHFRLKGVRGIETYLKGDSIEDAARRYFNAPHGNNLDAMMLRSAAGTEDAPRHIFIIVMESMGAWNLLEKYNSFELLPSLENLGAEGNGALIKRFVPAASGTMTSLAGIITGLPDAGVVTNYQPSSQTPYPTSIAPQFKRLGYRTRFFYGGYLSWQRIHDFCVDQGFEEIYGGGHMGNWKLKEWGVDDHVLFDFIAQTLEDSQPSFNVVLSTTYHSPYDIDIYKWGFPYRAFPVDIDTSKASDSVEVFGHLWYTDKVVGDFVRKVYARHPSSLFAVTGDHKSHNYTSPSYSLYERIAVPLLLYGKGINMSSEQSDRVAGSHLNIGPTLIELSAPKGFAYHSLDGNLLDFARVPSGFGHKYAITPSHLVDMKGSAEVLPLSPDPGEHDSGDDANKALAQRLRDHYAIGWWRIMKGPDLP